MILSDCSTWNNLITRSFIKPLTIIFGEVYFPIRHNIWRCEMRLLALFAFIVGFALVAAWSSMRIVASVQYDQSCGGYLKRAADANNVDLAKQELARALAWINANDLRDGYTSVAWRTPDEDVGFWHTNLTASLQELESVNPEASQLEKTNVLMKLRETLLDQGESTIVTEPDGISVYPDNVAYAWAGWISLIVFLVGCVFGFIVLNDDY